MYGYIGACGVISGTHSQISRVNAWAKYLGGYGLGNDLDILIRGDKLACEGLTLGYIWQNLGLQWLISCNILLWLYPSISQVVAWGYMGLYGANSRIIHR